MTEHNQTPLSEFKGKQVRIILTFNSGHTISYEGLFVDCDEKVIILDDCKHGHIGISLKDMSQVLPKVGV